MALTLLTADWLSVYHGLDILYIKTVLRIRIRRIHINLALPDLHLDSLVRYMDPDPQGKIVRKTLIPTVL
jgi:hypothetical protein